MADRTLKLTATFNDQGALTGLKVMNAELANTERAGKKTQGGLSGLSQQWDATKQAVGSFAGGLGIATVALTKAYGEIKEGAALELAEQRFDNLTESIGSTSDTILSKMGAATSGMMSNAEMIASASSIISLGLADTEQGVVDLASLVGQLGWDMQTVVLTFANNSKMRLDALGLSVEDVDAKTQKFIAQGHSMDEAFDLAVIEAGQEKLDLLGSAADSNAGSMERAEAQIENFTNSVKQALVPVLGTAAEAFTTIVTWQGKVESLSAEHADTVLRTSSSYEDYAAEIVRVAVVSGQLNEKQGQLVLATMTNDEANQHLSQTMTQTASDIGLATEAQWQAVQAAEAMEDAELKLATARSNQTQETEAQVTTLFELVQAYGQAGITTDTYTQAQEDAAQATKSVEQAMADLQLFMDGPLGDEYESFTQQNTDLEAKAAELRQTIMDLGGTEYMTPAQADQISTLQSELNNVTAQILEVDESIKSGELGNNQEYAATQNLEDLRQKAWELEQQIIGLGGQPFVTTANLEDLEAVRAELDETNAAIAANAEAHRLATLQILFDLAAQRAAMDGVTTSAESEVLTNLAYEWGLIDEKTKNATLAMDGYLADLNAGNATVAETTEAITTYGDTLIANEQAVAALDNSLVQQTEDMTAMAAATEGAYTTQTVLNETLAENGVGALTDYRNTLLELEEPMIHNAELIGTAAETAGKFNDELNAIPGTYNATINITTNGSVPAMPGSNGAPTGPGASQNFATGTDSFMVPTGYANDSYMIGLSSGERFSVETPAQQLRQAFGTFNEGGGDIYQITIMQMPGENAEALARRVVQILQEKNRR